MANTNGDATTVGLVEARCTLIVRKLSNGNISHLAKIDTSLSAEGNGDGEKGMGERRNKSLPSLEDLTQGSSTPANANIRAPRRSARAAINSKPLVPLPNHHSLRNSNSASDLQAMIQRVNSITEDGASASNSKNATFSIMKRSNTTGHAGARRTSVVNLVAHFGATNAGFPRQKRNVEQ